MPTYQYACKGCGEHLEVVQSFKDDALTECPACKGQLRKVFSAAGIIFKGSGWHVKDYASKGSGASGANGASESGTAKDGKDTASTGSSESSSGTSSDTASGTSTSGSNGSASSGSSTTDTSGGQAKTA